MKNTLFSRFAIALTFAILVLAAGTGHSEKRSAVVRTVEVSKSTDTIPVLVESEVPVAGVQIELSYDQEMVTIEKPVLSKRAAGMTLASHDHGGEMVILLYSLEGHTIPPGNDPVLTLSIRTTEDYETTSDAGVSFDRVILAGTDYQAVPVEIVPVVKWTPPLPTEFALSQNYPNPFNPTTEIRYQLSAVSEQFPLHTTLRIFNVLGQEIRTMVDGMKEPGYYTVTWDGKDSLGNQAASGVYFYRIQAGEFSQTKRMVLMK